MKTFIKIGLFCMLVFFSCGGRKTSGYDYAAGAYGKSAYACFNEGDFTGAKKLYSKALLIAQHSDMPSLKARYLFNIGRVYFEEDAFDSAQKYFLESYSEFLFLGDTLSASSAAGFICLSYAGIGALDSAKMIADGTGTGGGAFWGMVRGRLYLNEGRPEDALREFSAVADLYKKKKNFEQLSLNCFLRGKAALYLKDFKRSRELLDSSIVLLDKTGVRYSRWRVLTGLSALEFCTGEEQRGVMFYRRAQECAPEGVIIPALEKVKSCSELN